MNSNTFSSKKTNDENTFSLTQTDAALLRPHVFDILDLAMKRKRNSSQVEESEATNVAALSTSVSLGIEKERSTCEESKKMVEPQLRKPPSLLNDERSLHDVLEIADFLFGPLFEAALALLEPPFTGLPDGTTKESPSAPVGAVRRVCANPSGRIAYMVRGSGLPGRKRRKQGPSSHEYYYLCLLNGPYSSYYCSCRSFHDKLVQNSMDNAKMGSSCTIQHPLRWGALCKHLLAAKMAPLLNTSYEEMEVSEEMFAQLWLQSSLQDL